MAKSSSTSKKTPQAAPRFGLFSVTKPTPGNPADVWQMLSRLCCATGQAPAVTGYTLGQVKAVVVSGNNAPLDPSTLESVSSRTANPDANRNWKFCTTTSNELPVPSTSNQEGVPNTLHVRYTYYKDNAMPPQAITAFESVSWTVHRVALCGNCT